MQRTPRLLCVCHSCVYQAEPLRFLESDECRILGGGGGSAGDLPQDKIPSHCGAGHKKLGQRTLHGINYILYCHHVLVMTLLTFVVSRY